VQVRSAGVAGDEAAREATGSSSSASRPPTGNPQRQGPLSRARTAQAATSTGPCRPLLTASADAVALRLPLAASSLALSRSALLHVNAQARPALSAPKPQARRAHGDGCSCPLTMLFPAFLLDERVQRGAFSLAHGNVKTSRLAQRTTRAAERNDDCLISLFTSRSF